MQRTNDAAWCTRSPILARAWADCAVRQSTVVGGRAGGYRAAPDLSRALARRLVWAHALAAATRILRRRPPLRRPLAQAPSPNRGPPCGARPHPRGTLRACRAPGWRADLFPRLGWRTAPPVGCRRPMPAEGACMPGLHHRPWVSGADPDRYPVASGGAMAVRQSCRPVPTPPPPPSSPPRRAQRRRGRAARQWPCRDEPRPESAPGCRAWPLYC